MINKAFLKPNQLIDNAHIIRKAKIPVTIVNGRYDVISPLKTAWDLYKQLPEADLCIVADAGHFAKEPGMAKKLIEACDKYKTLAPKSWFFDCESGGLSNRAEILKRVIRKSEIFVVVLCEQVNQISSLTKKSVNTLKSQILKEINTVLPLQFRGFTNCGK